MFIQVIKCLHNRYPTAWYFDVSPYVFWSLTSYKTFALAKYCTFYQKTTPEKDRESEHDKLKRKSPRRPLRQLYEISSCRAQQKHQCKKTGQKVDSHLIKFVLVRNKHSHAEKFPIKAWQARYAQGRSLLNHNMKKLSMQENWKIFFLFQQLLNFSCTKF